MPDQLEKVPARAPRANYRPPARPVVKAIAEDEEDESFLRRHWLKMALAGVALAGVAGAFFLQSGDQQPPRKSPERVINIQPLPPLPPPPPPPPPKVEPPPPPEQKMIEQVAVEKDEKPPEVSKPKDEPPAALGTNIKGPGGNDGFGLGSSGNGGGLGLGAAGSGGKAGSKWGWYAGQVQSKIAESLRQNAKTRHAAMRLEVRVWADATGRIERAQLTGSTGDPALDRTLQNDVLTGLRLAEPPPSGMPMPIVLRLSARRPN